MSILPTTRKQTLAASLKDDGTGWIKLRGLPFSATETEIIDFLLENGVNTLATEKDVRIVKTNIGRPLGECYINVANVEEAEEIVPQLERKVMGSRYIEANVCTYQEARVESSNAFSYGYLRLRGIPWEASPVTIIDFLHANGVKASYRNFMIKLGQDGRPSGEVYVKFPTREEAEEALPLLEGKSIGDRYVERC